MRTDGDVWELYLPTNPVPAARPKVGRWGTYYPKTYKAFMLEAAALLEPLGLGVTPSPEDFHVAVHCVREMPRSTKLDWPKPDVDNFAKAVLDAVTKAQIIWCDDCQVVTLQTTKRWTLGAEEPHVFVRASHTMGGVWLDDPLAGMDDDIYMLPQSMRVPLEEVA